MRWREEEEERRRRRGEERGGEGRRGGGGRGGGGMLISYDKRTKYDFVERDYSKAKSREIKCEIPP
jgi:hypothetical protein